MTAGSTPSTTATRSPLLDLPGAVPAAGDDAAVAAHYGDPLREQRALRDGAALVDRSHREVVRIGGPDRLSWLHSITSQHLSGLGALRGSEALVLSPQGHVEHHLVLADDGTATWVDVEPGTAAGLLRYLESMRFLLRVEPADVGAQTAVLSVVGPAAVPTVTAALGGADLDLPEPLALEPTGAPVTGPYPVARAADGTLVRRMAYGVDLLVDRAALAATTQRLLAAGAVPAGLSAFDAMRIAARRPRLGRETDHRTIPHEVGWLADAVHLDKGCYRGQETVARVHNLGRPPRRLVLLHLDGVVAAPGSAVTADGREVGFVGTSEMHEELGPIALAIVKRSVPAGAALVVTDPDGAPVAAAIDPDDDDGNAAATPKRPAGRLLRSS
ncbi:folate-binding protein YgfZ [Frankia torreyi]|uniref:Folate-binding protein YgfZ n=1 Tax=Frankia torreyi TaxID=1856 RepID=A0A0D8BFY7_9ACTN|nr:MULTISPECIES: folate-binding protein YgfZ [Frankia]KJE23198.1 folate-binding protein YgfZ [Frankia torreyi]KQC39497.1 glycine cleavage system protein T [Frankia sp. ACN1ag]KQM06501.1 folate-binding protein YgfZ [Frankia sp. CpI1-P]